MLENWCWTPSQLKFLSQHYSTLSPEYLATWKEQAPGQSQPPEKIPDDLVDNLIKTKHVNDALFTLRQLHFGIYDMAVHEPKSHEELEKTDCTELFNTLRTEISALDGPEVLGMGTKWGHGQATFGHLIGKGIPAHHHCEPLRGAEHSNPQPLQVAMTPATTATSPPKSTPWTCSTASSPRTR